MTLKYYSKPLALLDAELLAELMAGTLVTDTGVQRGNNATFSSRSLDFGIGYVIMFRMPCYIR